MGTSVAYEAEAAAKDMELAGTSAEGKRDVGTYRWWLHQELGEVDVALVRPQPVSSEHVRQLLALGINTVDSFDIQWERN